MEKWIIFDFDGTIADSVKTSVKAYNILAEKYKLPLISKEKLAVMKESSIKKHLKENNISLIKMLFLRKKFLKLYESLINEITLFEEMRDLLIYLDNKGFLLAVLSSNKIKHIKDIANKFNLNMFDTMIGGASLFGKEHLLKKLIKKKNINLSNAVYVGDESRDIIASKKVNLKIISVSWGYEHKDVIVKQIPDYIVDNPNELKEVIISHFAK
ncbi:MAG: HAD hydrolase-like protein [Bacilli bacterium]